MKLGHQEIFEQMRREILAGKFDGENKLPSETTCRQPLGDLAHVAFQALLQRIKSPRLPPRTILLPAPLIAR